MTFHTFCKLNLDLQSFPCGCDFHLINAVLLAAILYWGICSKTSLWMNAEILSGQRLEHEHRPLPGNKWRPLNFVFRTILNTSFQTSSFKTSSILQPRGWKI